MPADAANLLRALGRTHTRVEDDASFLTACARVASSVGSVPYPPPPDIRSVVDALPQSLLTRLGTAAVSSKPALRGISSVYLSYQLLRLGRARVTPEERHAAVSLVPLLIPTLPDGAGALKSVLTVSVASGGPSVGATSLSSINPASTAPCAPRAVVASLLSAVQCLVHLYTQATETDTSKGDMHRLPPSLPPALVLGCTAHLACHLVAEESALSLALSLSPSGTTRNTRDSSTTPVPPVNPYAEHPPSPSVVTDLVDRANALSTSAYRGKASASASVSESGVEYLVAAAYLGGAGMTCVERAVGVRVCTRLLAGHASSVSHGDPLPLWEVTHTMLAMRLLLSSAVHAGLDRHSNTELPALSQEIHTAMVTLGTSPLTARETHPYLHSVVSGVLDLAEAVTSYYG
ncbi:hypothetical protein KIPB_001499 [Kipferlia bialata]|uniref:Uncharacterized protein n=1 Tax=Kipferlia bialata TaxID=797122 RepID=A0A9K3GFA9_9EUKA|nr:hypothetical protein KIPB_001499 [Kipferlia bialata]|eukprot:g1499.t1